MRLHTGKLASVILTVLFGCSNDNMIETEKVICATGEYSCQVRTLRICNDSRTGWIDVDV